MRIALITGGIRGIGAATAMALKAKGYSVVVNYAYDDVQAKDFQEKTGIPTYKWDVSDFQACQNGVQQIESDIGNIEILVNNAGIIKDGMMHKMPVDSWSRVINVNLGGCFNMCRSVIEGMRHRQWGRIVNLSSINALAGCVGQVNYSASKAGIIGLTKALALESAIKKITVNAIAPGYIETDMTNAIDAGIRAKLIELIPVGRMGSVDEIAKMAAFLVSDDAGFITGATFSVNGGNYMQ